MRDSLTFIPDHWCWWKILRLKIWPPAHRREWSAYIAAWLQGPNMDESLTANLRMRLDLEVAPFYEYATARIYFYSTEDGQFNRVAFNTLDKRGCVYVA